MGKGPIVMTDVVCPHCADLCDDLRLTVEGSRIAAVEVECPAARAFFMGYRVETVTPRVSGAETGWEAAVEEARMWRLIDLIKKTVFLIRNGHLKGVVRRIRSRVYSDRLAFGLRRDLTIPLETPDAKIPLTIRPLVESDISILLDIHTPSITSEGVEERLMRILLLQSKIPTCYVAVTPDGRPCYMQWLIGPSENDNVKKFFVDRFPLFAPDEALLEFALTLEAHRGQGIMPCAMAQIAKQAADLGARWVITFVMDDNIPSLKGCKRAGFVPYLTRREQWRLFHRRMTFTPLPPGTPYPFDEVHGRG